MTAEQLEELLADVTQGEWEVVAPQDGIWPPRVFSGSRIICMVDNSDATQDEKQSNATLIALAPELARCVIAAENAEQRLIDAASDYLKKQYGIGSLSNPIDRERIFTAYREASK